MRKSCDARSVPPVFSYVLDVDDVAVNSATVATGSIKPLKIRVRPKKCVRVSPDWDDGGYDDAVAEAAEPDRIDEDVDDEAFDDGFAEDSYDDVVDASSSFDASSRRVVVVGLGPAGLFAALSLAEEGIPTTVLERGQPVESRGRDIGALFARRVLDPDSNLCLRRGGAGTWSDGKLTTRIGRNSDDVRSVLRALVAFGAPREILVTGKPHLGTDRLVRILRNARGYLASRGVDLRFGQTAERVVFEPAVDEGDGRVARAVEGAHADEQKRCRRLELELGFGFGLGLGRVLRPGVGGRLGGGTQRGVFSRGCTRTAWSFGTRVSPPGFASNIRRSC